MKLKLLFILLLPFLGSSQQYFTIGECFDFAVGDVIQSAYSNNSYAFYTTRRFLSKSFSLNQDTVFYFVEKSTYTPPYMPDMDPFFTIDTITESYFDLSDTIHFTIPVPQNLQDSCENQRDSVYFEEFDTGCILEVYKIETNSLGNCFENTYYSNTYIRGFGEYYWEIGYDFSFYSKGTGLIYYKKGNLECGTFKSELNNNLPIKQVQLFPNPVSDIIYLSSYEQFEQFSIYSANGILVKVDKLSSNNIPVAFLQSGLYFLTLSGKNNVSLIQKFHKQ